MRTIDADALIRKLKNNSPDPEGVDEWISIIEKEPTVDVAISSRVDDILTLLNDKHDIGEISYDAYSELYDAISMISAEPKTEQWKDFAVWVAKEIFDEWEYNKDAFDEIACRKLAKLGIVRAKGDKWELVDSQESDVKE